MSLLINDFNVKKTKPLAISLPSDYVDAIQKHFKHKGSAGRWILDLINRDLRETGCVIENGVLKIPSQVEIPLLEPPAMSSELYPSGEDFPDVVTVPKKKA